ncbi:MAG: hypothetical protein HY204_06355 [Nitrospirae bacterium]|nr:hypothetical protein [Nitrospirota bacterium]
MSASAFRPRTAWGTVFVVLFSISVAAAEETPEARSAAASYPDLSADVQTTLIDRGGHLSISTVHIRRAGKLVRYENNLVDPPEVSILDLDQMKEYRIYAGDEIYFETVVSTRLSMKLQREGLFPAEAIAGVVEKRIVLREDVIEGHPTDIVLWIRSIKDKERLGSDYTLLWEARDLNRQPLRVAYYQSNVTFTLVELRNIKLESADSALMHPPSGFLNMSPF